MNLVAGTGNLCADSLSACGDGGDARQADLASPYSAAILPNGDILVGDAGINRIRVISNTTGAISTLIGSGVAGISPDFTPAILVAMNTWRSAVCAVTVDPVTSEVIYAGAFLVSWTRTRAEVLASLTAPRRQRQLRDSTPAKPGTARWNGRDHRWDGDTEGPTSVRRRSHNGRDRSREWLRVVS